MKHDAGKKFVVCEADLEGYTEAPATRAGGARGTSDGGGGDGGGDWGELDEENSTKIKHPASLNMEPSDIFVFGHYDVTGGPHLAGRVEIVDAEGERYHLCLGRGVYVNVKGTPLLHGVLWTKVHTSFIAGTNEVTAQYSVVCVRIKVTVGTSGATYTIPKVEAIDASVDSIVAVCELKHNIHVMTLVRNAVEDKKINRGMFEGASKVHEKVEAFCEASDIGYGAVGGRAERDLRTALRLLKIEPESPNCARPEPLADFLARYRDPDSESESAN